MSHPTDYLNALRSRSISFRMLQSELRAKGLGAASGWDGLLQRYATLPDAAEERNKLTEHFKDIYTRQLFYGRKAVSIFAADQAVMQRLTESLTNLLDNTSPFAKRYPMPVNEATLSQCSFDPVLVAVERDDENVRIISSCKRFYKAREPIELSALEESAKTALSGYDEVFGVKMGIVQAFDSIVLRSDLNRLEIHIDLCCPMIAEDLSRARSWYTERISPLIADLDGWNAGLGLPKNFFPLISKLYNAPDGNVISLGHATGTKSVKEEKMRQRSLDLREELFHKEGIRAIGHTDAFSIVKAWSLDGGIGRPMVTIPGHFSIAGAINAHVPHVIVDGCATCDDFETILAKLN